jgi:nitrogen fixation protein FixH
MKTTGWFANGIEGRHVLMGLIAFFGVMALANAALVYYALSTFSGGDRPDPYRSGLNYNETIAADQRQAALGWQATLTYDEAKRRLTLRFVDEASQPVSGLKLDATLSRAVTDKDDRAVDFTEIEAGVYAADLALAPGAWVFSLASNGAGEGDPVFRLKRRLVVGERP